MKSFLSLSSAVLISIFISSFAIAQTDIIVYVNDRFKTESIIKQMCGSRWPTDQRMQSYCENEQWQALDELKRASPGLGTFDLDGQEFETVRKHCGLRWEPDFRMWAYCEREQREAATTIKIRRAEDLGESEFQLIRRACAQKWSLDYKLRNSCEIQTIEAVRKAKAKKR